MADERLSDARRGFDPVSPESAAEYEKSRYFLVDRVNSAMDARDDLLNLVGAGNRRLMYHNHENHAAFMSGVFSLGEYSLLDSTVPWVYRAYHAHGFSFDYFPVALNAWMDAVFACLRRPAAEEIAGVYRWMISRHEECMRISRRPAPHPGTVEEKWKDVQASFLDALLAGDTKKCMDMAGKNFAGDRAGFFIQVIQPSMYRVGELWERGELSVAREHLASAVVSRVMISLFIEDEEPMPDSKGNVVVTAACNEYHEIGAWMVADLLERDGWHVYYLGANTPVSDVVEIVGNQDADICAVSAAMPFNLTEVRKLIQCIRETDKVKKVRVMVGGLAFAAVPELWRHLGADGYASDAGRAVELAERWWNATARAD
jgi:methanogenic corrinoid protein MtbC1